MIKMFGVVNSKGEHIDTSKTLHGAKITATRNQYNKVSERHGYNVVRVWENIDGKWIEQ